MIEQRYRGQKISDLPNELFWVSFDDSDLPDDRYPGLVIAALNKVPMKSDDMFLAVTDCGGFAIWQQPAAIQTIAIRPEIEKELLSIVDENFIVDGDLDYGIRGNPVEKSLIINGYIEALQEIGLSWDSSSEKDAFKLRQALYPVDATVENLRILTTDHVELDSWLNEGCELCIYIVGENCD